MRATLRRRRRCVCSLANGAGPSKQKVNDLTGIIIYDNKMRKRVKMSCIIARDALVPALFVACLLNCYLHFCIFYFSLPLHNVCCSCTADGVVVLLL